MSYFVGAKFQPLPPCDSSPRVKGQEERKGLVVKKNKKHKNRNGIGHFSE